MTYEAALNLFMIVAIPAVILVSYKLYSMSRKNVAASADGDPLVYTVDAKTGEIVFGDETGTVDPSPREADQDDQDISMVDVLAPEDTELAHISPSRGKEKILEDIET